jgi:hypothetical protein
LALEVIGYRVHCFAAEAGSDYLCATQICRKTSPGSVPVDSQSRD